MHKLQVALILARCAGLERSSHGQDTLEAKKIYTLCVGFGIEWGQKRLAALEFADDRSALSHTLAALQAITNNIDIWCEDRTYENTKA